MRHVVRNGIGNVVRNGIGNVIKNGIGNGKIMTIQSVRSF